jgi:hypothetical protein
MAFVLSLPPSPSASRCLGSARRFFSRLARIRATAHPPELCRAREAPVVAHAGYWARPRPPLLLMGRRICAHACSPIAAGVLRGSMRGAARSLPLRNSRAGLESTCEWHAEPQRNLFQHGIPRHRAPLAAAQRDCATLCRDRAHRPPVGEDLHRRCVAGVGLLLLRLQAPVADGARRGPGRDPRRLRLLGRTARTLPSSAAGQARPSLPPFVRAGRLHQLCGRCGRCLCAGR